MYYQIKNNKGEVVALTLDRPDAEETARLLSAAWALLSAARFAHETLRRVFGDYSGSSARALREAIDAATVASLPSEKQKDKQ